MICFFPAIAVLASMTLVRPAVAVEVADLQQRLEDKLEAKLPSEVQFITLVVDLVEQDKLPLVVVDATYQWALTKKRSNRFEYFQRGIRVLAARQGIKI